MEFLSFLLLSFSASVAAQGAELVVDFVEHRNVRVTQNGGFYDITYDYYSIGHAYCDGTPAPGVPAGLQTDLTWYTDDASEAEVFRWLNGRKVNAWTDDMSDIVQTNIPIYEAAGFRFGESRERLVLGTLKLYYREFLPTPGCRGKRLFVESYDPSSGVQISIIPADLHGDGGGTTRFDRAYNNNTVVTLTAPNLAGGNRFVKWQRDGVDWSTSFQTTVTMDEAHTMRAVYQDVVVPKEPHPFATGCPPPGDWQHLVVSQYRLTGIDHTEFPLNYRITYDVREPVIYCNFVLSENDPAPNWRTGIVIPSGTTDHRDLYEWLNGRTVVSASEGSNWEEIFNRYEANGFKWGETKQAFTDGVVIFFREVLLHDECDAPELLSTEDQFVPSGMSGRRWSSISQGLKRSGYDYPGDPFPALNLSFYWDAPSHGSRLGPSVDLLCASFEKPVFSSLPSLTNRWTTPTWIVTKGADLNSIRSEATVRIQPAMLGLPETFHPTNDPSVPSMSPLKLIAVECFPQASPSFARLTYETSIALGFQMVRPSSRPEDERRYVFSAGHQCHLIYEYPLDSPSGGFIGSEWFVNAGNGATNDFLCLNPLVKIGAIGGSGYLRFKVADAPGFINWNVQSVNGDANEVARALQRLKEIFAAFHSHSSAPGFGGDTSYLPSSAHGLVSANGPLDQVVPFYVPEILFQAGPLGGFGKPFPGGGSRHLNYITGKCDRETARDQRRRDQQELLSELDGFNWHGESQFHVALWGMAPRFPIISHQSNRVIIKPGEQAWLHAGVDARYVAEVEWFRGVSGDESQRIPSSGNPPDQDTPINNSALLTAPLSQSAQYWFRATNIFGFVNSQTIEVIVSNEPQAGKPAFDGVLSFVETERGRVLELNAPFSGSYPLSLQWYRDGVLVPNATNAVLLISAATAAEAGEYSVVVANASGSITGQVATVTVQEPLAPPTIIASPTNQTVFAGTNVTLSVAAQGHPLNYQWLKDGIVLSNATQFVLALSNVDATAAGSYVVRVYNEMGVASSAAATLTVTGQPVVAGTVLAWGDNGFGETTVPVAAQGGVVAIAAGWAHTVALKADGSVLAWGRNVSGQPAAAQSGVKAIAAGAYHIVALKEDGSVLAWGNNELGQTTVPASAQGGVKAIAAGYGYTLALKENGSVLAWGHNAAGQTTVPAAAQSGVKAIAAGTYHAVALKEDGSVLAWGSNVADQSTVPVAAQSGVVAIAAGWAHTVALKADGSVLAWGDNEDGQTTVPADVQSGVVAIAAGSAHTVALKENGSVLAWGLNNYGQTDVPMAAQSGVLAIAAGFNHTVALILPETPMIINHPISRTVMVGQTVTYSVTATGTAPITYQWRKNEIPLGNGGNISGANTATLILSNLQSTDAGMYDVVVSNSQGSTISQAAQLVVTSPPPPLRLSAYSVTGNGISFQLNGGAGHTNQVLRATNINGPWMAIGTFMLTSNGTTLFTDPNPPRPQAFYRARQETADFPSILTQPVSVQVAPGASTTFSVVASGSLPLSYRWRKNSIPLSNTANISGSDTAWLMLTNIQTADEGSYDVVVSNVVGSVQSQAAVLTMHRSLPILGYLEWYKADSQQFAQLADGQPIVNWLPEAGSLATPGIRQVPGSEIIYRRSVPDLNGMPALEFPGAGATITNIATIDFNGVSIFLVFRNIGSGGAQRAVAGQTSNTLLGPWHPIFTNVYAPAIHLIGVWKLHPNDSTNWINPSPCVLSVIIDDISTEKSFINGMEVNSTVGPGPMDTTGIGILNFSGDAVGEPYRGYISEFIVYKRVLSAEEIDAIHNYLLSKYGLRQ